MNLTLAAVFGQDGWIQWYQIPLIIVLVALIIFYWQYKKKQY